MTDIPSTRFDQRYSELGLQAANTLRWLENSGPRYRTATVHLVQRESDGAVAVQFNPASESVEVLRSENVSFASWLLLCSAKLYATVEILLRTDPVGAP